MALVRLLGPIDVVGDEGRERHPGSPLRRTILALLGLHAGQVLSPDWLMEQVWADEQPDSGLPALRFHVSKLRKEVGDLVAIVTRPGGYQIDVPRDSVDALRFDDAVRQSGLDVDERARARCAEALRLWRGQPFIDAAGCATLDEEAARLEEGRLTIVEHYQRCQLASGAAADLIPDLTTLVTQYPLREALWSSLIIAQYRAGQQADALRSYERLRTNLADLLGLDPSPELRELQLRVLSQDAGLLVTSLESSVSPSASSALPSGTLTFLFSDIEGSTALWERAPEAMSLALASHDRLMRETFERAGGTVFGHRGDGLSVVFTTASDAVRGALAALRANVAQDWNDLGLVRIRVGIHTGEATQRDDNYFGSALNLTGRLTAAAHGNQILVSDTVRNLVGERVDDRAWLEDLGPWFFDGLARAERVHQVRDPGLGEAPMTLRAGRPAGAALPTALGRFVGRDTELRTVVQAFDSARLVTLCGVAGAGKTRLAIEIATTLTERFTAGPRFVDLTRVRDASAVLPQIADALAVRLPPGAETIDGVARTVASSPVLVVLDNCEHLTDVVAEHVSGLLQRCRGAGVLATSREPLRIPGERVIEIRPLGIGSVASPGAAVEMLLDRAHSADAAVVDDDPALHDLALAVDGLPLALELLAPRLTHMKPAELATQLSEIGLLASLDVRPERARDAGLRTAFASSHGMLAEGAQRLFAALSVCVGGTTIEGAQHLVRAAGLPATDVRAVLSNLVDESLVVVDTSGAQSRYRMLNPVREFAAEHLTDLGCAKEVELAHVSFLAMFVEREGAALRGPQEARAVERIDADFDNLRAAARWCVAANRPDLGFRIVAPLVDHLLARGRYEVGTWALALTEAAGADLDALFPLGLGLAALTAMEGGQLADADALSTRALTSEAVDGGTRSWIAYSVRVLLTAAGQVRGDLRAALSTFREVVDAADDQFGRAVFHFDRATIMKYGPAPVKVLGPASELEMLGLTTGCPSISAMGSMVKGWGLAADNRPTEAAEALRQSITLAMSVRNLVIAEMANRELMDVERASLNSYGETLRQFLEQNDIAQVIVTVLGMLPSLIDLEAYEAAARICGWILRTPWARSAQLSEAMRRLAEHLDEASAQAARSVGERMDLDQLVRFLTATIAEMHDSS